MTDGEATLEVSADGGPADRVPVSDLRVPVLIVDDYTLSRDNLVAALAGCGYTIGAAWDLPSMVQANSQIAPEVVLFNIHNRDCEMLMVSMLQLNPQARIIVLGVPADDAVAIVKFAEIGVVGYHIRYQSMAELMGVIRRAAAGESFCTPEISTVLLRRLSELAAQRQAGTPTPMLTTREAEILRMLRMGLSNKQIAAELCIAVHTVKNHVHSLLAKLAVRTRAEAAALPSGVDDCPPGC